MTPGREPHYPQCWGKSFSSGRSAHLSSLKGFSEVLKGQEKKREREEVVFEWQRGGEICQYHLMRWWWETFFLYNKDGSKNSLLSSLWMLAAGKILGSLRKLDVRVHHVRYLAINSVDQMAVYIPKVTLCHQISMELFSTFQLCVLVFRQLYCFWSISLVFFSATSDDRFQEPLKIV